MGAYFSQRHISVAENRNVQFRWPGRWTPTNYRNIRVVHIRVVHIHFGARFRKTCAFTPKLDPQMLLLFCLVFYVVSAFLLNHDEHN